MKFLPAKNHIHARFINPPKRVIETVGKTFEGTDKYRTRVEVLGVGPDVKSCKVGDFLLLIPEPNILPIGDNTDEGLITEAAVLGTVLDDKRPMEIAG